MDWEATMRIITPFLLAGIVALVGWVWKLWGEHRSLERTVADLRLHIAENYPKNGVLKELSGEVRHLSRIVVEIAGKLGVKVDP